MLDFPRGTNRIEITTMAVGQQWLFAPAQPLVERLGRTFFRTAPAQPGVYIMRDASGAVSPTTPPSTPSRIRHRNLERKRHQSSSKYEVLTTTMAVAMFPSWRCRP